MDSLVKTVLFALPVLFLTDSLPALAEQWVYIGVSDNDRVFSVDFDSVRGTESTRTFWFRMEDLDGNAISLSRVRIDCQAWESETIEVLTYSSFASPRRSVNPYPQMQSIPPGTMIAATANFICPRITETEPPSIAQPSQQQYPRAACGDPAPSVSGPYQLYPVFVAYSDNNLRYIQSDLCRDAFRTTREDGRAAIQVASFTDRNRAYNFADFLRSHVRSGEVGTPNNLVMP